MFILNNIKIYLSIILLIIIVETNRRRSGPRPDWYEREQFSTARQQTRSLPVRRFIDDTYDQSEDESWPVQPDYQYDDYQEQRHPRRPRPNWNRVRQFSMARPQSRVINGQNATDGDAPYACVLQTHAGYLCTCSLITENAVITAAHCIKTQYANGTMVSQLNGGIQIYAFYGGLDRLFMEEINYVTSIYLAPNYAALHDKTPRGDYDDLAILRLKDRIYESYNVKFIEFHEDDPSKQICKMAQISGWGVNVNSQKVQHASRILQVTWMRLISKDRCNQEIPELPPQGTNYTCARYQGVGLCNGDSGSPVVIDGKLVGVVSQVLTSKDENNVVTCAEGQHVKIVSTKKMMPWINLIKKELLKDDTYHLNPHTELRRRRRVRLNGNNVYQSPPKSVMPYMSGSGQQFISRIKPRTIGGLGVFESLQWKSMFQISMITKWKKDYPNREGVRLNHYCGGAIIGKKLAVTAARCMYKWDADWDDYYVRYGGLNVSDLKYETKVKNWWAPKNIEPDCSRGVYDLDIALLELTDEVIIEKDLTQIIALKKDVIRTRKLGQITGWGTHQSQTEPNLHQATMLQYSLLEFHDRYDCLKETRPPVEPKYHCAILTLSNACLSDDGGPLATKTNGIWQLAGVLARSKLGCDPHYHAAVYVEVGEVRQWIDKIVQDNKLTPPTWA